MSMFLDIFYYFATSIMVVDDSVNFPTSILLTVDNFEESNQNLLSELENLVWLLQTLV